MISRLSEEKLKLKIKNPNRKNIVMRYRDHKAGLEESLKSTQNISSLKELKKHLDCFYKDFGKEVEDVNFKHIGYDKRINWETYYVLVKCKGEQTYSVAGMSDGDSFESKQSKDLKLIIFLEFIAVFITSIMNLIYWSIHKDFPWQTYPFMIISTLLVYLLVIYIIMPISDWWFKDQ